MASSAIWKPTPKPVPRWNDWKGYLDYMMNWVVMLEENEKFDRINWGCVCIIEDYGLLWRNFKTKVDKYIAFNNILYFRMNDLKNKPELGRFLEIGIKRQIVTTIDENKPDSDKMGSVQDSGQNAGAASWLPEDTYGNSFIRLILLEGCGVDELHWHLHYHYLSWCGMETERWPTINELLPPGQFTDAEAPPKSDSEKEREWAKYEELHQLYTPAEDHKGIVISRILVCGSRPYFRRFTRFRPRPLPAHQARERFDEALQHFYKKMHEAEPRHWLHRQTKWPYREQRLAIAKGQFANANEPGGAY